MNIIEVQVTTSCFKAAKGYMSLTKCPLAIALKRKFPKTEINVGGALVDISFKPDKMSFYRIYNWVGSDGNRTVKDVCDGLIIDAKKGLKIQTFNVVLRKSSNN